MHANEMRRVDQAACPAPGSQCNAAYAYWILIALFGLLFFTLGQVRLIGSADEAAIMDPAVQVACGRPLAIPSAGPGNHHEDAFFYQTPGHVLVLGWWLRWFGISWQAAHALTAVLALAALVALRSHVAALGWTGVLVAAVGLAVDPGFAERARIIRYDHLAVALTILAGAVCCRGRSHRHAWALFLSGGVMVGAAASCNFLYLLYGPALALAVLASGVGERRPLVRLWAGPLWIGIGTVLALIPCGVYAWLHRDAFFSQFVFQIFVHREAESGLIERELSKLLVYYSRRYFLILPFVVALLAVIPQLRSPDRGRRSDAAFYWVLAVAMTVLLTFASGGKSWHQLVVVPAWWLLIGYATPVFARATRFGRIARVVLILAFVNGFVMTWLRTALEDGLEQGRSNASHLGQWAAANIPSGAAVYADRKLVLEARQRGWRFVADYGDLFNTDWESVRRMDFNRVLLRRGLRIPEQLEPSRWKECATWTEAETLIDRLLARHRWLTKFFYLTPRGTYVLFERAAAVPSE